MKENKIEKVVAIVVAYNIESEKLLKNIYSYYDFVEKIVIVDNSNKSNNLKDYENEKIVYIGLGENLGIARALNEGIKYAIINNFKYALTMDQDSSFNNNLIRVLFPDPL